MNYLSIILLVVTLSACSPVVEGVKKVWGSSTQTLERERVNGIRQTYSCRLEECYAAVKALTIAPGQVVDNISAPSATLQTFIEDPVRRMFVVIGVPGNINTTEVGIFFNPIKSDLTSIEISSLSSSAKRKVAGIIELTLQQKFTQNDNPTP